MSTLADLRDGLEALVPTLLGADVHSQWRDKPRDFVAKGAIALLHLRSFRTLGTDEQRMTYDAGAAAGSEMQVDVVAQRQCTLSVLVECFAQDVTAFELLEKLRIRLQRPAARVALSAIDAAFVRADEAQELPTTYDQRVISAASVDVRLAWATADSQADYDADADETDATTFIEVVEVSGVDADDTTTIDGANP